MRLQRIRIDLREDIAQWRRCKHHATRKGKSWGWAFVGVGGKFLQELQGSVAKHLPAAGGQTRVDHFVAALRKDVAVGDVVRAAVVGQLNDQRC